MKRSLASSPSLALLIALAAALGACRGSTTTDAAAGPDAGGHSGDCAVCHLAEFNAVTHPMHPGKKPTTCAVCHREDTWGSTHLDHRWPLEGAHRKADCFLCHQGTPPVFEGTTDVCDDCHRPEFDKENARNPAHLKFGVECQDCHTPVAWKPAHDRVASPAASAPALVATTTAKPTTTVARPVVTPTAKPIPTPTTTTPRTPKPLPRPPIITGPSSRR